MKRKLTNFRRMAIFLGVLTVISFASCKSTEVEEVPTQPEQKEEKQEEQKIDPSANIQEDEDFSAENQKLIEQIEAARKEAIDAGAQNYYPDLLVSVDDSWAKVKNNVDANPKKDHSKDLNNILTKYKSLQKASQAQELKAKADAMDGVDEGEQKLSNDALLKYLELGNNDGSGNDMLNQAETAYNSYFSLLNQAQLARAGRERKAALSAKKDADSVKAAVAKKTKEQYKSASNVFKKADVAYSKRNIDEAYDGYKSSKETFTELYEIVKKDREEAQARLEAAKARVAASANTAAKADAESPLKEKVSGIEDESTTLLEKDQFANPEDSVINLEEGEIAKTADEIADKAIANDEAESKLGTETVLDAPVKEDSIIDEK